MNTIFRNLFLLLFLTLMVCTGGIGMADTGISPEYYLTVNPTISIDPNEAGSGSGWFSIDSSPRGADVYVDGTYGGTSPARVLIRSTANPSHSIRVIKSGYQEWTSRVIGNPKPGETISQTAYLVENQPTITTEPSQIGGDSGWFFIDSSPRGADVYVDGTYGGTSPARVSVRTTANPSHTIRVIKSGYQEWTGHVSGNPGPGETVSQTANLVEIQPTITVEPTSIGGDYGWFKIDSDPQGAEVYFDGTYYGTSPVLAKVYVTSTPSHDYRVSMSGYEDYTKHLSYNPGRSETVTLNAPLVPLSQYGSISVTSDPSDALATLDSGQQYQTPCTFSRVDSGMHTITVSKSGYAPYTSQVQVSYDSQAKVDASLTRTQTTGSLFIDTVPQGVDVRVDNLWQGQSPQKVGNLVNGYHTVKLQLSGYQSVTQQVMITTGQENRISITMIQNTPDVKTGSISVSTTPSGASVYLNNNYQGTTPSSGYLDLTDLTAGVYTIHLTDALREDYSSSVTVIAGQITPINVVLKESAISAAVNGTLSVSSSPAGAQVLLNNQFVGITPLILSTVVPGEYGLLLKMDGYSDDSSRVQIVAGMPATASITLNPVASTPAETPTPVPTTTRSPLPLVLVPAGLAAALALWKRAGEP